MNARFSFLNGIEIEAHHLRLYKISGGGTLEHEAPWSCAGTRVKTSQKGRASKAWQKGSRHSGSIVRTVLARYEGL